MFFDARCYFFDFAPNMLSFTCHTPTTDRSLCVALCGKLCVCTDGEVTWGTGFNNPLHLYSQKEPILQPLLEKLTGFTQVNWQRMTRRLQSKNHRERGGGKGERKRAGGRQYQAPPLGLNMQVKCLLLLITGAVPLLSSPSALKRETASTKLRESKSQQGIQTRCYLLCNLIILTHVTTTVESTEIRPGTRAGHTHTRRLFTCAGGRSEQNNITCTDFPLKPTHHFLSSLHCHWPDLQYRL